jgi:4-hydroxy-3-methylbut-2-enyl diphosphate reductase
VRVIVAETAGFCWGVQRAIDFALSTSRSTHQPVYTHGPLIHNSQVIEELKKRNITPLEEDMGNAKNGTLVIRAHGLRPDEMRDIKSNYSQVIDATCPLVMKVHRKIQRFRGEGYRIYIMGEAKHPEVLGLIGSAGDEAVVIPPDPEAVKGVPYYDGKACLVSQTTQNDALFASVANALKERCAELVVENTICNPTRSHQQETMEIAANVDMVVVVGGRHSANTRHLAELAASVCPRVIHIETDSELDGVEFADVKSVGITAGASTPQWMIRRVVDRIEQMTGKTGVFARVFRSFLDFIIPTNLYSSCAFAFLYLGISRLLGLPIHLEAFIASVAVVFGIHSINEYSEDTGFDRRSRFSPVLFERFRIGMLALAFLSVALSVSLTIRGYLLDALHWSVPIAAMLLAFGGIVYGRKLVPAKLIQRMGFRSIKDLPGSKDLSVSIGWTLLFAVVPIFSTGAVYTIADGIVIFDIFLLVYRRSAIMAVQEVKGDRIVGMESSFKFLGKSMSTKVHIITDVLIWLLPIPIYFTVKADPVSLFNLLSVTLFGMIGSILYRLRRLPQGLIGQFILDSQFVIPGLIGWIIYGMG